MAPGAEAGQELEQKCAAPYPHAALSPGFGFREMTKGWARSQRGRKQRVVLAGKGAELWALFWVLFLISRGSLLGLCPVPLSHSSACPISTLCPRALLCLLTLLPQIFWAQNRTVKNPSASTVHFLGSILLSDRPRLPYRIKEGMPASLGLEVGWGKFSQHGPYIFLHSTVLLSPETKEK